MRFVAMTETHHQKMIEQAFGLRSLCGLIVQDETAMAYGPIV
jgi:hypothetical protein